MYLVNIHLFHHSIAQPYGAFSIVVLHANDQEMSLKITLAHLHMFLIFYVQYL